MVIFNGEDELGAVGGNHAMFDLSMDRHVPVLLPRDIHTHRFLMIHYHDLKGLMLEQYNLQSNLNSMITLVIILFIDIIFYS